MATELPIIQRLKREMQELQRELSVDIPRALEEARAHGDLSENAEFDAARERQGLLRARLAQKEAQIRALAIYSLSDIPRGSVAFGSEVSLENLENGEVEQYRIVLPEQVDASKGCISLSSPLGRALLNRSVGDEVEVRTPRGRRTYEIVELLTLHDLLEEAKD